MERDSEGFSTMTLDDFNQLDPDLQLSKLMQSCHCKAWAGRVVALAPFADLQELLNVAASQWETADEKEILEAFAGHPQIGDIDAIKSRYALAAKAEQGQVLSATENTLEALKIANDDYFSRNGFIFVVCATGKSADEMLTMIRNRLRNSREAELVNGAREQAAITKLRLKKMIEGS